MKCLRLDCILRGQPRCSVRPAAAGGDWRPRRRGARREVAAHARSRARCTLGRLRSRRPHSAGSAQGPRSLSRRLEREAHPGSARWRQVEIGGLGGALSSGGRVPAAPGGRAEERRSWLLHVWLLDAEAAAAAAARSSSSSGGGARMLGQQQQLYSSAALLTGERSRLLTCYVQDYLECVESLPHDMQRNVSVLRELDNKYQETLKEIDDVYEKYKKEDDSNQKKRLQQHLQRALINSQELGDEKIQIVTQMLELVENRARQMELRSQCLQDPAESERASDKGKMDSSQPERSSRRPRRQRTSESRDLCHMTNGVEDCEDQPPKEKKSKSAKKKKRSKAKQEREASPVEFAIDPNEPTYCLCNQVSYGEMIGCDNEQCPIEWFHFSCVSLTYKPKGKWYCPKCRGDNEKTMDKSTEKTKKERRAR